MSHHAPWHCCCFCQAMLADIVWQRSSSSMAAAYPQDVGDVATRHFLQLGLCTEESYRESYKFRDPRDMQACQAGHAKICMALQPQLA